MNGDTPSIRVLPSRLPAAWHGLLPLAAARPMDGCGTPSATVSDAAGPGPSHGPGGVVADPFLEPPGWRAAEGFGRPALGYPR